MNDAQERVSIGTLILTACMIVLTNRKIESISFLQGIIMLLEKYNITLAREK
jgi:hypothetical protein